MIARTNHESTGFVIETHADKRSDLEASRDLTDQEKQTHGFLLARYEQCGLRLEFELARESAVKHQNQQVISKARKAWKLQHEST